MSLVSNLAAAFTAIGVAVKAAKNRVNHTGTQLSSTISDFTEASQDAVGTAFDTTLVYNDAGNSMGRAAITGDVTVASGSNAATIPAGTIVNAQVSASAAIALSKLAPITGYTSGAGTVTATDTVLQAIQKLNGNTATLSTSNVTEGTNQYFTNAKAISAVLTSYASGTGVVSATDTILQAIQKINGNVAALSTSNVAEGTNLYFTNTRAIGATLTGFTAGAGAISAADTVLQAIQKLTGNFNTATTSVVPEGSNLYYTNARGIGSVLTGYTSGAGAVSSADTILGAIQKLDGNVIGLSTTNVAEGSNLYYTNGRAIAAPLTGLSTSTATAAAATDSILAAIGKLEARMPISVTLTSAFSSSSTTSATVTGWTVPVVAGGVYKINVLGTYQTAAVGTGGRISFGTITSTGTILGVARGAITAAAAATELSITLAVTTSGLTTTGVSAINTPHHIEMDFIYRCTASGNIPINWASEVNLSASQLNIGSTLIYQRLS